MIIYIPELKEFLELEKEDTWNIDDKCYDIHGDETEFTYGIRITRYRLIDYSLIDFDIGHLGVFRKKEIGYKDEIEKFYCVEAMEYMYGKPYKYFKVE